MEFSIFTKARSLMIIKHPFFGGLIMRLKAEPLDSIGTAATDGTHLYYNEEWFNSLELEQAVGLLAHEVMHCALGHTARRGERDPQVWNEATDHAINLILKDSGVALPPEGLWDRRYKGLSAEQIYDKLTKDQPPEKQPPEEGGGQPEEGDQSENQPENQPDKPIEGSGGWGQVWDAADEDGNMGEAVNKSQEREWKVAAQQAAQSAKAQGKLSGSLKEAIDDLLKPKVDWRIVLQRFVKANAKNKFDWNRPNRRMASQGVYTPRRHSKTLDSVVIMIDTSGSMDTELLRQSSSELSAILEEFPKTSVYVIQCDTEVNAFYKAELPLNMVVYGRGGTRFQPAFDKVEEEGLTPACAIYFTDLYASSPEQPDYPVLWATESEDMTGPFGETVHIT
jgi:predicted metal-dependent peptidase